MENRPGGGATIGGALVVSAPPDGHTLLLASSTFAAHPTMFANLPYDTAKDLLPVVGLPTARSSSRPAPRCRWTRLPN